MGYFSWMFANTDNSRNLRIGKPGYLYCPDGAIIHEPSYEGYGEFCGMDVYDLVADWNRKYLSEHPDFLIVQHEGGTYDRDGRWHVSPPKKVSEYFWYPLYADLSKTAEEIVSQIAKTEQYFEYRFIGIDIACYDDQNAVLPFPIKICSKGGLNYSDLPASKRDPEQGAKRKTIK